MALGEIADTLGEPKSGVHRLLTTLVNLGWAEQDPHTGFYRLTMRLTLLGQRVYADTGIPDLCQPLLDELATREQEYVRLAVVAGGSPNWLADAQGATGGLMYHPPQVSGVVPLHATASGKAFLRIRGGGDNPLDMTGAHPETYPLAEQILRHTGLPVSDLMGCAGLLKTEKPELFANERFASLP